LGSYLVALLTLLSVGSIGMLCSVLAPNVLAAILSSYVIVALLGAVCLRLPACAAPTAMEDFNLQLNKELGDWQAKVDAAKAAALTTAPAAPIWTRPTFIRKKSLFGGQAATVALPPGTPKVPLPPLPSTTDIVPEMMKTPAR